MKILLLSPWRVNQKQGLSEIVHQQVHQAREIDRSKNRDRMKKIVP